MRISRELEISFSLAVNEARRRRHEFLCIEHLLYALLQDDDVAEIIRHCGGDLPALKHALEQYLDEKVEKLPPGVDMPPQQTLGFHRCAAHEFAYGRPPVWNQPLVEKTHSLVGGLQHAVRFRLQTKVNFPSRASFQLRQRHGRRCQLTGNLAFILYAAQPCFVRTWRRTDAAVLSLRQQFGQRLGQMQCVV